MSLTDRDRKIVMLIVPVLLLAVYWFLILSPKRKEATKLSGQVTQAQQARDTAVSTANSLEQARSSFATQYSQMVRLGKAIPTQVDMPSLIVQLDSAARGTGIQFADIKVGARVPAAPATSSTGTPPSTSGTSTGTTGASGATPPPVAAGGAQAQTTFGKAAESANNAAAQGNAQAVQQSGLSAGDASTSTASKSGGLPVGGGAASAPTITPGQPVPGLDTVPLTFTFGGKFGNLAQFFHRLKRFVHMANNKISVQGRLITIDSLKFTSTAQNFPFIEADVSATVYLSPKDGGTTAGATAQGPAATTPGATPASSSSTPSSSSAATAAVTPPTSAITR
jgi:Type II secretion system (T2SS), protein M